MLFYSCINVVFMYKYHENFKSRREISAHTHSLKFLTRNHNLQTRAPDSNMSSEPSQQEPQGPAAQGGEKKTEGTDTNGALDPFPATKSDATATHDTQDPTVEESSDATATHDTPDPAIEESSDESEGEWSPSDSLEDLLYGIPLDDARLMVQTGHVVQDRRKKLRGGRTLSACRRRWT